MKTEAVTGRKKRGHFSEKLREVALSPLDDQVKKEEQMGNR